MGLKIDGSDCPILRLPNEILSDILSRAIEGNCDHTLRRVYDLDCEDGCHLSDRSRRAAELSNTCRHIRNMLVPETYSVFRIYHAPEVTIQQNERLRKSMSRVHEILRDNPGLGLYCKTLRITLDDPTSGWRGSGRPIIPESMFAVKGWLSNTTHLVIDGIDETDATYYDLFSDHVTAVIHHALMSFPRLTTLSLKGNGIFIYDVLNGMRDVDKYHSLSSLEMSGFNPYGDDGGWDDELRVRTHGPTVEFYGHIMQELPGTAPMQKLELNRFDLPPEALEALVRWPKELHSLSVRPSESQLQDDVWHCGNLQPILEIQIANLRELNLYGLMVDDNIEILDLTGFTMLERLSLPARLTGVDMHTIPRILAPNLRFLEWQISLAGYFDRLGVDHYRWLLGMVELAAQQQQKLKTIFVALEYSGWYSLLPENSNYPWDVLDDADMDSKKLGVRIRYDEPSISKEDFEVSMAELEEERMQKRMWSWGVF